MTLKVRDRVVVIDSKGFQIATGTIININDFREPSMKYAVDVDDHPNNPWFMSERILMKIQEEK